MALGMFSPLTPNGVGDVSGQPQISQFLDDSPRTLGASACHGTMIPGLGRNRVPLWGEFSALTHPHVCKS